MLKYSRGKTHVSVDRHKCPKCLMRDFKRARRAGTDTTELEKALSIVCNTSPYAWTEDCNCVCGAGWLPLKDSSVLGRVFG